MKVAIYSAHHFEREYLERANKGKHLLQFIPTSLGTNTIPMAAGYDAVALFANDDGSSSVLESLRGIGIKYVALRSTGYNHIDLDAAKKLGIKVANVPEYSPYAVAEHTVALMLALNRNLIRANKRVEELNFLLDGLTGFDMHGKTVGIVGVGRIGAVLAAIMKGFGCQLLGYDIAPNRVLEKTLGLEFVDLDALCTRSDIITLHAPLVEQTKYIISKPQLEKMKKGVMLINTSRGALLDTREVINSLKSGKIGYLGLDVYEEEKGLFFEDHSDKVLQDDVIARLMTFKNVMITSHQAFLTTEALQEIAETTIQSLDAWEKRKESRYRLN